MPVTYAVGRQAVATYDQSVEGSFSHTWLTPGFFEDPAVDKAGFIAYLQQQNEAGREVYFSIAAFHDGEHLTQWSGRKQQHALGCKVVVMDLDYLKHGKDLAWSLSLLDAMQQAHTLPAPTLVVDTGGGIHGYWHMTEPLAPEPWGDLASRFSGAFAETNATVGARVIDTQCTVDIARVLRVPGFYNNKYPHRPTVQVVRPQTAAYTIEALTAAMAHRAPSAARSAFAGTLAAATPVLTPNGLQSAFSGERMEGPPASWSTLVQQTQAGKGCEVLRIVLADNNAAGYEPWCGLLSIAAHTDAVDEAILAVSAGHKDWAQHGLEQARWKASTFGGPRTCAQFAEHMPQACMKCANSGKITSPIVIARRVVAPPPAPVVAPVAGPLAPAPWDGSSEVAPPMLVQGVPIRRTAQVDVEPDFEHALKDIASSHGAPYTYHSRTGAVTREIASSDGVEVQMICNRPMWVVACVEDSKTVGTIITLHVIDRRGRGHDMTLRMASLAPDSAHFRGLRAQLQIYGVSDYCLRSEKPEPPIMTFISALMRQYTADSPTGTADVNATHMGSVGEGFTTAYALGEDLYRVGAPPSRLVRVEDEKSELSSVMRATQRLPDDERMRQTAEFRDHMAAMFGHPDMAMDQFLVSSALGTALSGFVVPPDQRGGIISIESSTSGTGKSSAMRAAASMFTTNTDNLVRGRVTPAAIFKTFVPMFVGMPVVLDDWDKTAAQGSDRATVMARLGELVNESTNRTAKTTAIDHVARPNWSSWIYITANISLRNAIMLQAKDEATGMRMLAFEAEGARIRTAQARAAHEAYSQWSVGKGAQVAHTFLMAVMTPERVTHAKMRYGYWTAVIQETQPVLADPRYRFIRAMIACTAAAADIAAAVGILPFDPAAVVRTGINAAIVHAAAVSEAVDTAARFLEDYLAEHMDGIVHTGTRNLINATPRSLAAVGLGGDTVAVPASALNQWLRERGDIAGDTLMKLRVAYPQANYVRNQPVPVGGGQIRTPCYVVDVPGFGDRLGAAPPTVLPASASAH